MLPVRFRTASWGFLRDAYNEMTATLRRLVWIIGCFFLFLGMRIVSAWALQRIESLTKIMHLGMMMAFLRRSCGRTAKMPGGGRMLQRL